MSFSFNFTAQNRADAVQLLLEAHAPPEVKEFVKTALLAVDDEQAVRVIGSGHLFSGDYKVSNCSISVDPITYQRPAYPPKAYVES